MIPKECGDKLNLHLNAAQSGSSCQPPLFCSSRLFLARSRPGRGTTIEKQARGGRTALTAHQRLYFNKYCKAVNVCHRYNRAPIPSDTFSRPALDFWDFSRPKDRKWLRSGCESVCKVITNGKTAADGVKVCRMIDNVHFTKFRDQFIFHLSTTILHKDIAAGLLCGQPVEN